MRQRLRSNGLIEAALAVKQPTNRGIMPQGSPDKVKAFFGSDHGGKTAAVLRSFVATCKRAGVEPFAWFQDVLSRIARHPMTRLAELLPHNWKSAHA